MEEDRPTQAHILATQELYNFTLLIFRTEKQMFPNQASCVGTICLSSFEQIIEGRIQEGTKILCVHLRSLNDNISRISNGHYEPLLINGERFIEYDHPFFQSVLPLLMASPRANDGIECFKYDIRN